MDDTTEDAVATTPEDTPTDDNNNNNDTTTAVAGSKRSAEDDGDGDTANKKPTTTTTTTTTQQLQQQIQQQLQQQLQAQLQAAAARGQQANITPEQIQAQAQAMVQAAAQAQAVVAAAKNRGDGLVPMTSAQIAALSQIQAQAIVHARKSTGTPQQIQTQIQLQAQALVHAHTQAQIQAGIYKGEVAKTNPDGNHKTTTSTTTTETTAVTTAAATTKPPTVTVTLTPAQMQQHEDLKRQHEQDRLLVTSKPELERLQLQQQQALHEQLQRFSRENNNNSTDNMSYTTLEAIPSATSPEFLAQLASRLQDFWRTSLQSIHDLQQQTEQDFKNHNDLPLARIKRIMKSDEDVRMISAEAPVLFAKACELFILDLSIRAFEYSQLHKRRTLQKEDVKEAIQKTDIFDFLVDVIQ